MRMRARHMAHGGIRGDAGQLGPGALEPGRVWPPATRATARGCMASLAGGPAPAVAPRRDSRPHPPRPRTGASTRPGRLRRGVCLWRRRRRRRGLPDEPKYVAATRTVRLRIAPSTNPGKIAVLAATTEVWDHAVAFYTDIFLDHPGPGPASAEDSSGWPLQKSAFARPLLRYPLSPKGPRFSAGTETDFCRAVLAPVRLWVRACRRRGDLRPEGKDGIQGIRVAFDDVVGGVHPVPEAPD